MMRTSIGPMEDTSAAAYLRPETAQGIFVNFKNIYQSARKRPPFGVAQIGKSFRNEITPGNFTFRSREFEQAELEYFVPDDGNDMEAFRDWVDRRKAWYASYGIASERLRFYELTEAERPHYAKAGIDVEYLFPWGWGELESIAHRGTYDLDAHMELSGKDLRFFDEASEDALHAASDRELGRHGPHDAHVSDRRLRTRAQRRPQRQGDRTRRSCASTRRSRRSRWRFFRSRATNPNWSNARVASRRRCARPFGRSTTKATSASSTAGKTRSERRFA